MFPQDKAEYERRIRAAIEVAAKRIRQSETLTTKDYEVLINARD